MKFQESDLDTVEGRKKIIEEITGPENIDRKEEALRRHEIYRDKTKRWVVAAIAEEGYKPETVAQMANRAANISVARKIVNKLAVTYSGGVDRKAASESDQKSLDALGKSIEINKHMKKTDRYRQLFHNCILAPLPMKCDEKRESDGQSLYRIGVKLLAPWEYDVIEDANDPTKAGVVIITDFPERSQIVVAPPGSYLQGAEGVRSPQLVLASGDGIDQIIADAPADKDANKRTFIWWSANRHFTTDDKGEIIPDPDNPNGENPIKKLPWVTVAVDQDGFYWSTSGADIIDGSVLINKLLTDIAYIAFVQGWGQLVVAAKEIPAKLKGGPDNAFLFQKNEGDSDVQVFFASSNPPIAQWLETMKTYLSLLLSTNDLSPRSVSGQLDVSNAASGVALLIDSSELMNDLQDNQQIFQDIEPCFWDIANDWLALYKEKKSLVDEQMQISPMKEPEKITLQFHELKPPISEDQKVKVLKDRKELGLNTLKELIMKDNPHLTDEQAEEKVLELQEEKKSNMEMFGEVADDMKGAGLKGPGNENGAGEDQEDDEDDSKPVGKPGGKKKGSPIPPKAK